MSVDFKVDPLRAIYERLAVIEAELLLATSSQPRTHWKQRSVSQRERASHALALVRQLEDLIRPTIIEGGS